MLSLVWAAVMTNSFFHDSCYFTLFCYNIVLYK